METYTFEQIKDEVYGKRGTPDRAKIENDGENITLKTLFDVVERGLGGKLVIQVQL